MSPFIKTILRSIRESLGRFIAILAIIALGVGFMCGLVQSSPSFMVTGEAYIDETNFFDYRLLSTIGFDESDIEQIRQIEGVKVAQGAYSADVLGRVSSDDETTESEVRIHSITEGVNTLKLEAGRLPENPGEIVVDGYKFDADVIGQTFYIVSDPGEDDSAYLNAREYTVVGVVWSPIYFDFQRGTTNVGRGRLYYYGFVLPEDFNMEYYTESYIFCDTGMDNYTDEYEQWSESNEERIQNEVEHIVRARFDDLMLQNLEDFMSGVDELESSRSDASQELLDAYMGLAQARAALDDVRAQIEEMEGQFDLFPYVTNAVETAYEEAQAQYDAAMNEYNAGLVEYFEGLRGFDAQMTSSSRDLDYIQSVLSNTETPNVYVLGRDTNVGCLSFENDAKIVDGIAKVFPVFFFALAALVCSTTMQRMVLDERGIIGTMRALGYTDFAIVMKYVIYSGLAALIGSVAGYFIGIRIFPFVIWDVYGLMYGFSDLILIQSVPLFITAIFVSLLCSVGVSIYTAATELQVMPAELIRPKAPVAGKKILLERITPLWKSFDFNNKVSLRNVFRFKKRMWMMLIGIAGCSALLITGFGILDSITGVVDLQYDKITPYRMSVGLDDGVTIDMARDDIAQINSELGTSYSAVPVRVENVTHTSRDAVRDVVVYASSDPEITNALRGRVDGEQMPWPGDNEVAISAKLAERSGLQPGDQITFEYNDGVGEYTVTIAYVFENYVYHYAFMNEYTYEQAYGKMFYPNQLLILTEQDPISSDYDMARELNKTGDFGIINVSDQTRTMFGNTMEKMNIIIVLIIGCAAALAFIVLFNLNNINISERVREIATIKVLGFSKWETGAYFFRENFILVFMGFVLGVPVGIILHQVVVREIEMDMVALDIKILPLSYLYSLLLVILFSVIVDLVMRVKIERIDMAESLKSAE